MPLKDDLSQKVAEFASTSWGDIPNGHAIPAAEDLTFGNDGRRLEACILYADLRGSTRMVDAIPDSRAAEYYKAYLHCAGKLIRENGGEIQAYDGDRVMGVFLGAFRADNAVETALNLNYAVAQIINPTFLAQYTADRHRPLEHTVGIDASTVLVAKTGVRVDSDLVWVGPAANYAAKLNSFEGLDADFPARITVEAFNLLRRPESRTSTSTGALMWDGPYTDLDPRHHYRTAWKRDFS
jgi:class 3 adenylate cyclase